MLFRSIAANLEAIEDCGVSFASKNIVDLKQKLSSLINRPDTMRVLGRMAEERAQSEYDWHAIAKRTVAAYEDLIAQKSGFFRAKLGWRGK